MNKYTPATIACLLIALAVGLGAFGAHALKESLSAGDLNTWKTGVEYHFYNGLGLLILSLAYGLSPNKQLARAIFTICLGILLFSGSLYLLSTMGWKWLGPVTPIGGLAFIIGWLLAIPGLKQSMTNAELR